MIVIYAVLAVVSTAFSYPSGTLFSAKDLSRNNIDQDDGTYLTVPDSPNSNEYQYVHPYISKILREAQQENSVNLINPNEAEKLEKAAYLHIQTVNKNKRYASYLTLCHFKICNMGRKRTTRYFHVMNQYDNQT